MKSQITCPECHHQFDVENALSHDIEHRIKKKYLEKLDGLKSSFSEKEKALNTEKERLEKLEANQKAEIEKLAKQKAEDQLKTYKLQLEEENRSSFDKMTATLKVQKEELLNARKEKLAFQERIDGLKEREEQLELEVKIKPKKNCPRLKKRLKKFIPLSIR